jgi:hypothetical protein
MGTASTGEPCFATTMRPEPLPFVQLTVREAEETFVNVTFEAGMVGSDAGPEDTDVTVRLSSASFGREPVVPPVPL